MNKHFFLFVLLMAVVSLVSCAQKKSNKTFTVAFYNVENFFDTKDNPLKDDDEFTPSGNFRYTETIYKQKLHNIANVLSQLGTDVSANTPVLIGLAEVENKTVLADLTAQPEISDRGYKCIIFEGPDPRGINVGLLYDPKRFRLLAAHPVNVTLAAAEGHNATRDILFVTGVCGVDTITILVNHWPSRREGTEETENKRETAAVKDRKIIDSLLTINANAKIICMGDFNDDPDNESILNILKAKGDKDRIGRQEMFNPWLNIYKSGTGTLLYKHHWDLFDQIILSPAFLKKQSKHLHFSDAAVFRKDFLITQRGKFQGYPHRSFGGTRWINGYSDHLPVTVYLEQL